MYTISCCRSGKYPRNNLKCAGVFYKEFRTLSELASFMMRSRSLCYPNLKHELSNQEVKILASKLGSRYITTI